MINQRLNNFGQFNIAGHYSYLKLFQKVFTILYRSTKGPLCTSECCQQLLTPHQPCDKSTVAATRQQVGNKNEFRSLNTKWYKDYPWIHLCATEKKIFCFYCLQCYKKGLLTMTKKYENAFMVDGFNNWKKATERFERHQLSECHKEAQLKLTSLVGPSIIAQLNDQASKTQAENRTMLLKQLSSLSFLLRQGLAIRGHTEVEGNLLQLMTLQSEDCPGLKRWLDKHQYLSHAIVNKMIIPMGNTLLRTLLVDIQEASWFSILADETRDISNEEQLVIIIRWVNKVFEVQEDLIGMIHVPSTTIATLTASIKHPSS